MFKRIGATIVTIVMLLSMASVFSSALNGPMELQVELVDSDGNPLTTAAPGDTVNAVVTIHNTVALSTMAVVGTYSTDLFEPAGEPDTYEITVGENELAVDGAGIDNGEILAGWVASTDVELPEGAILMTVPLRVKADADLGDAVISFRFVENEMYTAGEGGEPTPLDALSYSAEQVSDSITIDTATTPVGLDVVVLPTATVDSEITVEVRVKDYVNVWSAMTIKGSYNKDQLELIGEPVPFNFQDATFETDAVIEKDEGVLGVTWLNVDATDVPSEFTALTLTFKAKAEGETDLSFSFVPEGILDADGKVVSTNDFQSEEATATIAIAPSVQGTTLSVDVKQDSVKVGETVTVKVDVADYKDNWAVMTIMGSYDDKKFELQEEDSYFVKFSDGGISDKPVIVDEGGKIAVTWINDDAVVMEDDPFIAMELTFKVKTGANTVGEFEFSFLPEGILDADGNEVPTDTYAADTTVSDTVSLLPIGTKTSLEVSVDEDSAYVGETVTVRVKVKDYANLWSGMTIQGRYDADKLAVEKVTPKGFQTEDINPEIKAEDGEIKVCWANAEAVETENPNFEALEIVFNVLKEGEAEFGFSFVPDGIVDGNSELAPADWYDETEMTDTVVLEIDTSMPHLEVTASKDRAKVGEQITYTVNVADYKGNWLGMSIFANYNRDVLKFIGATRSENGFGFENFEADGTKLGTVQAAWWGDEPVVLGSTFEAMQIVFEVLDEGDPEVSFAFPERGIIVEDPDVGAMYAPEGSFSEDAATAPVELFIPTFLEIDGESVAKQDEEYTVELKLKEYKDNWSSFAAEFTYDPTIFTIEDAATKIVANAFGGVNPSVNPESGKITVSFLESNANIVAGEDNVLLRVTFKTNGFKDDVVFNAKLNDVQTFDGNTNAAVDPYEYEADAEELSVDVNKIKVPHLTMVLKEGNAMLEGDDDGELYLYLNEYTSEWCTVPIVLEFNKDLIRIKESDIVCNPLGGEDGQVLLRSGDGKVVFTWISHMNIQDDREQILLASIPFKAYQDGEATFSAEFVTDSVKTRDPDSGFAEVDIQTYVPKAEDQIVTIADQYENVDPMFLAIGTVDDAIKNKKEPLTLTVNNLNNRVQALSVKLFYDKSKVTIDQEDIDEWQSDRDDVTGMVLLNEDEGYVHFVLVSTDYISTETTLPLMNLYYTPKVEGEISFYAEIDLAIEFDQEPMVSVWDYVERSETAVVNVKAQPHLIATADKTDDVKIGDTVTVTVSVKDYLNAWSAMAINGSYNKDLLKLESIVLTDAFGAANKHQNVNEEDGTFTATWSNASNVAATSEFNAIVLVFKVIEGGIAEFEIAFEEILTDGTTPLIPDQDYAINAEQVDAINIKICNHIWSDKVNHKEGTSGDASMHILTCTNGCGVIKEVDCTITKTFGKATCDKPGTITYNCAICGYKETVNDPNVPALGHKFDGKPVHKAGTKKHVYTCTRGCGTTKEENCSYTTHVENPTCVKDGYTIFTCTVCGDSYTGDVVKANDNHGALILRYFAPNATTGGSIITQCDICKEYVTPPYAGAVKKTLKAGHPFPDVQDPTMWYYDAVNFSKAFEIFGGDDLGNFNPASNITRGQLVTVLGRIMMAEAEKTMSAAQFNAFLNAQTSKVSGMKSTSGFTDLGGKYYERYAKLFAKWGIVNGYPDGTFGGDNNITREEMATLIKRFVEAYRGSTANITFGSAATFKDFAKVSGWAKGNVEWVGKVGLFQGDTEKNYNPQSNATRAEIAVVIYRMLPVLEKICVCMDPVCHSCPWAH